MSSSSVSHRGSKWKRESKIDAVEMGSNEVPLDQLLRNTWDIFKNIAFTYGWLRWKVPQEAVRSLLLLLALKVLSAGGRRQSYSLRRRRQLWVAPVAILCMKTKVLISGQLIVKITVHS